MNWSCDNCVYSGYAHRENECNAPNGCVCGSAYKAENKNKEKS